MAGQREARPRYRISNPRECRPILPIYSSDTMDRHSLWNFTSSVTFVPWWKPVRSAGQRNNLTFPSLHFPSRSSSWKMSLARASSTASVALFGLPSLARRFSHARAPSYANWKPPKATSSKAKSSSAAPSPSALFPPFPLTSSRRVLLPSRANFPRFDLPSSKRLPLSFSTVSDPAPLTSPSWRSPSVAENSTLFRY